jgi:hypothetical protein
VSPSGQTCLEAVEDRCVQCLGIPGQPGQDFNRQRKGRNGTVRIRKRAITKSAHRDSRVRSINAIVDYSWAAQVYANRGENANSDSCSCGQLMIVQRLTLYKHHQYKHAVTAISKINELSPNLRNKTTRKESAAFSALRRGSTRRKYCSPPAPSSMRFQWRECCGGIIPVLVHWTTGGLELENSWLAMQADQFKVRGLATSSCTPQVPREGDFE